MNPRLYVQVTGDHFAIDKFCEIELQPAKPSQFNENVYFIISQRERLTGGV